MNATMSLVMHFLLIVSVVTLGFGTVCALFAHPFLRWSNRFEPRSRLILLRLFAAWPLLGGLTVGVMVSLPSLSHASKLPLDHCHNSRGCLGQPASHMLSAGELAIIVLVLSLLVWAIINAVLQWRRAYALAERIDTVSHAMLAPGVRLIEATRPLAFSLGLFRSFAVLSSELVRGLTPHQLDIVCAHEQMHLRHHDNWHKWALRLLCAFHWPNVKRALLAEHAVTMELRADQEVASQIQDPFAVATTIIAVQRLVKPLDTNEPLCQFAGTTVERRVQYLLAQSPGSDLPKYFAELCVLTAIVAITSGSVPLHNALESLIAG